MRNRLLFIILFVSALGLVVSTSASGVTTSIVEAESLTTPPSCWVVTALAGSSGGNERQCTTVGQSLVWIVTVSGGHTVTLDIVGRLTATARTGRYRIDGAFSSWVSFGPVSAGTTVDNQILFTTPTLDDGGNPLGANHQIELEYLTGPAMIFDYYRYNDATLPTTTTTSPTTTTTTIPSTTTTTIDAQCLAAQTRPYSDQKLCELSISTQSARSESLLGWVIVIIILGFMLGMRVWK